MRLFFARGDGLTRLRLAQLARRQAELESALQRGARPRVLMALELSVAASTSHLVDATRRLEAAGNPAPALAAREAVGQMHERIDALTASETRPEVARTLRRMSNFLEGQERELGGATPGATPAPVAPATPALPAGATPTAPPRGEAPGALATPAARPSAITTREVTPTAIAPREATPVATRAPTSVPREVATPVPAPTRVPTRVP